MTVQTALDWFVGIPLRITIIVIVAVLVEVLATRIIRRAVARATQRTREQQWRQLRRTSTDPSLTDAVIKERTAQRAQAIGSLLRSVVTVLIWTVAILTILPLLDINIGPLVASAGIVGVALGFGAQTLVKDYISGVFLILEDQFGIGDIVELDHVVGTVELVSLRYTRMRDADGVIWYIRNGEIRRVANQSQGWTMATVDVPVSPREDIARVRQVVQACSRAMQEDPEFRPLLLDEPPVFAGVESVGVDAVIVRVTAKASPQDVATVTRAIRERLKAAFDAAGIRTGSGAGAGTGTEAGDQP